MSTALFIFQEKSDFELYVRLIEVIIWPITLLIVIFLFRNNFSNAFKRLGSFEASATGISMTFQEVASQAMEIAENIKPLAIAKSAVSIHGHNPSHRSTPFEQVAEVQQEIQLAINNLAKDLQVNTADSTTLSVAIQLEKKDQISYKQLKLIESIEKLINISDKNISQAQVNDLKKLKNALIKKS